MQKANEKALSVYMNGELVGSWEISRNDHQFSYAESWYNFKGCRPISLSLPLQYYGYKHKGKVVENYFDNLLPDSIDIRKRFQSRFRTPSIKAFDLLSEIGRDCIGAVQLLPSGENPQNIKSIHGKSLNNNEIEQILKSTTSRSLFPNLNSDEFRISLAGAQEKTALTKFNEKWLKPEKTTPSTHIFKLPLGIIGQNQIDLSNSIENEWLCLKIFQQFGLPTTESEIQNFGSIKSLVVKRFDRKLVDNNWFVRIPQEDICQVMGVASGLKYENEGGIGIKKIMDFLLGSQNAEKDRYNFFKSQIMFWLLAAPDGHAKNFSIFIKPNGKYCLTPFYDIISAYPLIGKSINHISARKLKMAMSVTGKNKHYKWDSITYRNWFEMGKSCGLSNTNVHNIIDEIVETAPRSIDNVNALILPGFPTDIAESVLDGFLNSIKIFKN